MAIDPVTGAFTPGNFATERFRTVDPLTGAPPTGLIGGAAMAPLHSRRSSDTIGDADDGSESLEPTLVRDVPVRGVDRGQFRGSPLPCRTAPRSRSTRQDIRRHFARPRARAPTGGGHQLEV